MNHIDQNFKNLVLKILPSVNKYNINPKYIVILSFILVLKSYFDLGQNNLFAFCSMFLLSQYFNELYGIYISKLNLKVKNYSVLQRKLNYLKFMLFIAVILIKYGRKLNLTNIIVLSLILIIYLNYSPCYKKIYNQDSEKDFDYFNTEKKLKKIYNKKDKLKNNFLFGDICSVIFLICVVVFFEFN